MLTKQQVDEIEARAQKATPGTWYAERGEEIGSMYLNIRGSYVTAFYGEDDDAAFIAAARTDVPALCATARELRELIRDLQYLFPIGIDTYKPDCQCNYCVRARRIEKALK